MQHNRIKTQTVLVNGKVTHFWQRNPQATEHVVLALHGFMSDLRSVQPFVNDLNLSKKTRVLLPDLPGFGASDPLDGDDATIDEYVRWAYDFVRTVVPEAKELTIIGYSFGAYIAVKLGAQRPMPLRQMVLITPVVKISLPVRVYSNGFDLLAALSMQAAHKLYVWPPSFDFTTYYLSKTKDKTLRQKLRLYRRQELDALRPELVLNLYRRLDDINLKTYATQLHIPVFVVMAEKDNVAFNYFTRSFLKDIPGDVTQVVIDGAGHLLPFEDPVRLAAAVNEYFD